LSLTSVARPFRGNRILVSTTSLVLAIQILEQKTI
jgi:hypothetical protein